MRVNCLFCGHDLAGDSFFGLLGRRSGGTPDIDFASRCSGRGVGLVGAKGNKGQTVKIIDFDNPENNEFLCTNQFKVSGVKVGRL